MGIKPTAAIIGAGFMGGAHTEALRRIGVDVHELLLCESVLQSARQGRWVKVPRT